MQTTGYRGHKVVTATSSGLLSRSGAFHRLEVDSATDTLFYPNALDDALNAVTPPVDGIPIKAGVTRVIPMQVYTYKADAPVTIVAYRS